MSIVNCKVEFIRPQYNNLEEWVNNPNNVYIGRAGVVFINGSRFPKVSSNFANPFKTGNRDEIIQKYRSYIIDKLDKDEALRAELLELKGKNLGCWCYPKNCHGNVLLELIDEYSKIKLDNE